MNATAFWRLAWKEYRAIRFFWISLVGLVIVMQWLTVWLSKNEHGNPVNLIFQYALGGPALFAVGCAGSAFAIEKEEGTFNFLRAAPVSQSSVFFSKLGLAMAATVAAYLVRWPVTLWRSGGVMPEAPQLSGMLGLWPVAALEAIAWGTLFSLLTARPLLSVALGMSAAAITAIVLSWTAREYHRDPFELAAFGRAAPLRAVVTILLLGIDAYLGSHWLRGDIWKKRPKSAGKIRMAGAVADADEQRAMALRLLARRSRWEMFARLLWQQWRQSRWLILSMCVIALPAIACIDPTAHSFTSGGRPPHPGELGVLLAAWASFCGAMVFRADQERHSFRFFAEHNVPPRLVWLVRQTLWITAIAMAVLIVGLAARDDWSGAVRTCILLSFAAGQWTSMFIRSGILAGFFGLIFAMVLCGWIYFIEVLHVRNFWSILSIPVVLLWSTWLRAPDWISENTRWSARFRAAASTILPLAALMVAVATFRVLQIPRVSPGFDPAQFAAELKPNLAAGLETAEFYRKAADAYSAENEPKTVVLLTDNPEWPALIELPNHRLIANQECPPRWLTDNAKTLELTLTASQRPHCMFGDPLTENDLPPNLPHASALPRLVRASARQLETVGKLKEGLDRLFAALVVTGQTSVVTPWPEKMENVQECFTAFTLWGAQQGQTADGIHSAIRKLQAMHPIASDLLGAEYRLKSTYLIARRSILANEADRFLSADINPNDANYRSNLEREILWGRLMPWENHRAVRVLNMLIGFSVRRLGVLRERFHAQDRTEPSDATPISIDDLGLRFRPAWFDFPGASHADERYYENALNSTVPDVRWMSSLGTVLAQEVAEFEARRRGTILVLALQSYGLKHGELPKSLADLVGHQLERLPLDPYSGQKFLYFPDGVPELQELIETVIESPANFTSSTAGERAEELDQATLDSRRKEFREKMSTFGRPGAWCTGPDLMPGTDADGNPIYFKMVSDAQGSHQQPAGWCWPEGMWFPIPAEAKK